ncbi:MAG TPA: O-antigen ligase family protein [Candidatus Avimonoglobus intestinipullorum]|uniref:O-antigen ligase family protein n=1 Tax=Candidatus Avimonoglobus intestinipullorum TaxID=2840699 RepID=A0A9D1LWI7_9FIRM|nr:O-antigen ligase family protein [Candidatus Avimonoglobus intestinipullorum]
MKNSVIIHFFAVVFRWIAECYNNSGIEKGIDKICNFFVRYADHSAFINTFRNHFMEGNYWRASKTYQFVMLPVKLLKKIGNAAGDRVCAIREKSIGRGFFENFLKVSLRDYGVLLLCLMAGYAVSVYLFGKMGRLDRYIACGGAAVGIVLLFINCSLTDLFRGSIIAKWAGRLFTCYSAEDFDAEVPVYHLKCMPFDIVLMLLLGIFMGYFNPIAALLSFAAASGILLILWKTEIGVFLTVMLAPIMPTMVMVALIGVTVVSFVIRMATNKDMEYVVTPFSMLIFAFLALVVLSGFTSVDMMSSIPIVLVYVMFTFSYMLIVNTIKTRSAWNMLLVLFVLCGALVSLYGIYQNFAGVDTAQSWVDTQMFEDIIVRVYSTFDNPNVLGQYLILMIPVAFAMLLQSKGSGKKIVYTIVNLCMFACLLYTWSRGAWVGAVLSLVFFVLLRDRRWLIICLIGLLLMPSVLPASILERLTSIGNMEDSSTAYRVSVWVASLRMARDYWMSGIGIGFSAFEKIYPAYALNGAGFALHAHNFYIEWVVEMGVLGLLTFLALILTAYKQIAAVREKKSLIRFVTLAMAGALLGYLFQGMAENLWYNYRMVLLFWIYMGILQSGVNISNGKDRVVL